MKKTAVILLNLGGPDSTEAVQPFLENLFNDPDIFKLPFQKSLARYISAKRAPKIIKEYELIGGKSPIGQWTEIQRKKLENKLRSVGLNMDVFIAMRYWKPLTEETVKIVENGNYDQIILLPLYPHYSKSTTGSSYNEWLRKYKGDLNKIKLIRNYFDDQLYIKAVNQRINEALLKFPEDIRKDVQLVFSAHGTPVSYLKKGDPYSKEIGITIKKIMILRNNSHEHHLCFQSKVGPLKWLEPSTSDMIKKLAGLNKKHLLIIPISFVSDHIETLYELNIQYRKVAEEAGIETYIVMEGLNDSDIFIDSLFQMVKKTYE